MTRKLLAWLFALAIPVLGYAAVEYGGGGGSGGTPGGSNTQVQFNNSGAFGGSPNFTWNGSTVTTIGIVASTTAFNGVTYNWPQAQGAANRFLQNDGSGNVSWQPGASVAGSNTQVQFNNSGAFGASANYTFNGSTETVPAVSASTTAFNGVTYYWPQTQGAASTFLKNDGAGNASWAVPSGTPAGNNTQVQFNNSGAFGASASFTWNGSTVTVPTIAASTAALNGVRYSWPQVNGPINSFLRNDGTGTLNWGAATSVGYFQLDNNAIPANQASPISVNLHNASFNHWKGTFYVIPGNANITDMRVQFNSDATAANYHSTVMVAGSGAVTTTGHAGNFAGFDLIGDVPICVKSFLSGSFNTYAIYNIDLSITNGQTFINVNGGYRNGDTVTCTSPDINVTVTGMYISANVSSVQIVYTGSVLSGVISFAGASN